MKTAHVLQRVAPLAACGSLSSELLMLAVGSFRNQLEETGNVQGLFTKTFQKIALANTPITHDDLRHWKNKLLHGVFRMSVLAEKKTWAPRKRLDILSKIDPGDELENQPRNSSCSTAPQYSTLQPQKNDLHHLRDLQIERRNFRTRLKRALNNVFLWHHINHFYDSRI